MLRMPEETSNFGCDRSVQDSETHGGTHSLEIDDPEERSGWKNSKFAAIIELALISVFIVAQNTYKILPLGEVPYLVVLFWLLLRLRGLKWASLGLSKPVSWTKTIVLAMSVAVLLQVLSEFVTQPIINYFTQQPVDLSDFADIPGNLQLFLIYLALIWTLAAFGEEMVYRGYIMNRTADVGGRSATAWAFSVIFMSLLFGVGHYYHGISGIIGSAISGLFFAGVYLYSGRNLWASILAHGFSDTIGLLLIYLGWYKI